MRVYFLKNVQEDTDRRISGPPSRLSYQRREVMIGMKSFYVKMIKLSQISRRSATFSTVNLTILQSLFAKSPMNLGRIFWSSWYYKIVENVPQRTEDQKSVTEKYVHKIISNLDIKKATGADIISAKNIKSCASSICNTISDLLYCVSLDGVLAQEERSHKQRKFSTCKCLANYFQNLRTQFAWSTVCFYAKNIQPFFRCILDRIWVSVNPVKTAQGPA